MGAVTVGVDRVVLVVEVWGRGVSLLMVVVTAKDWASEWSLKEQEKWKAKISFLQK
jgi:hypothetical protein